MTIFTAPSPRKTVASRTSGASPPVNTTKTIHLLGLGKVGRAFLEEIVNTNDRLVAAADSTATIFCNEGLRPRSILEHKQKGRPLRDYPGAQPLPTTVALSLVNADVVVDATPTDLTNPKAALDRALFAVSTGSSVALAAKDALFAGAEILTSQRYRSRVGVRAPLGGAGADIAREIDILQKETVEIEVVANATTTTILNAYAQGHSQQKALDIVRAAGLLESDPEQDLSGADAAVKLAIIAKLIFNDTADIDNIAREHIHSVDPARAVAQAGLGRALRLVGRARRGEAPVVCYQSIEIGSALVAPPDRLIYQFKLRDGSSRLFVGFGVGPKATASALLLDIQTFAGRRQGGSR